MRARAKLRARALPVKEGSKAGVNRRVHGSMSASLVGDELKELKVREAVSAKGRTEAARVHRAQQQTRARQARALRRKPTGPSGMEECEGDYGAEDFILVPDADDAGPAPGGGTAPGAAAPRGPKAKGGVDSQGR